MERMEGTTLSTGLAKGVAIVIRYEMQRTIALPKPDQPDSILRADVHGECERSRPTLGNTFRWATVVRPLKQTPVG